MPMSHTSPNSRRDSWPPTQVRLTPTVPDEYPSLDDIDDDPLTYFLTPAPGMRAGNGGDDDVDMMDLDLDLDAGIESASHPREIVRSVSPSSLDGLDRSKPRKVSPQRDLPDLSDVTSPDTDEDDEEEDYIRFQPRGLGFSFNLGDFALDGGKGKPRPVEKTGPASRLQVPGGGTVSADALLSPSSFHIPGHATRGRPPTRPNARGRSSHAGRRRPQHLWREPSPDVWSIEEDTEGELLSELGSSVGARSDDDDDGHQAEKETKGKTGINKVDGPAAKPKKKVRFVLPAKD